MFTTQFNVCNLQQCICYLQTRTFYSISRAKTATVPIFNPALSGSSYLPIPCGTELEWEWLCANPAWSGSKVATHTPSLPWLISHWGYRIPVKLPVVHCSVMVQSIYEPLIIINKSLVTADKSTISRPNSHSYEYLALSVLRFWSGLHRSQLKTQRQN